MNVIIKAFASFFGTGYSPVASGTVASALSAVFFWFFSPWGMPATLLITAIVTVLSVPAASAAERLYGKKDDSHIVIDETVGMWIALLFMPHHLKAYAAAFVAFRVLDVIKPFFIKRVQSWHGGWGVVADDFFAGIGANIIVQVLRIAADYL